MGPVVAERLADVRERIKRAGGAADEVTVVAVTKGFGSAAVEAATAAGLWDLGENYAQELVAKALSAPPAARWHFLGEVQRNKVARLAGRVHLWQGLDTADRAAALGHRAPGASVLVEVKLEEGPGRRGAPPEAVPALVETATKAGLEVKGLMAVGPREASGAAKRFRAVAELARKLGLPVVSMGMSNDFELAVAEGATMVRLGRALFGPRPPMHAPGPSTVKLRW